MAIGVLVKVIKHQGILAMAKQVGYDFVLLDNEHGFFTYQELHDLCMYAASIQMKTVVRISEISKTHICKTLDAGAKAILVPMVESAKQVDDIVNYAYYPPLGFRGYAGGANTNYAKGSTHEELIEIANGSVEVYVQIETKQGLKNSDDIVKNPLLRGVVIGPADLAISLGHPGQYMQEDQLQAMNEVAELCRKHNKVFGIIGNKKIQEKYQEDTNFVVTAIDTDLIYTGLLNEFNSIKGKRNL